MYERRSCHAQNVHERLRHSCIVHDQIGVHTSMNTKQKEFNLLHDDTPYLESKL